MHHATPLLLLLAEKAGYKGHGAINLGYGKLAKKIRAMLHLRRRSPELSLLVDLVRPPSVTNTQWIFVMRPEFANALRSAKWV
jgi:hypothetical protein